MEDKRKKSCKKCRKVYYINALNSEAIRNIPLFLPCGHSMCEKCVRNYLTFAAPIECAVCHQHTEVNPENLQLLSQDPITLYSVFPINIHTVGEITLQAIQDNNVDEYNPVNEYFINIEELLKGDADSGKCVQCRNPTPMMCEQCDIIVCRDCFHKSHHYVFFRNHTLSRIVPQNKVKNNCISHPDQPVEFYCKDCCKPICMDCSMANHDVACQGHFIVTIEEENINLFPELEEIIPKVDDMFGRLINTAKEIGNALTILNDDKRTTAYSTLLGNIDANFSKLNYKIQYQKYNITQKVLMKKAAEINSLKKAKSDVTEIIVRAKNLYKAAGSLDRDNLQEENIPALLDEAKAIADAPWCLRQQAVDQPASVVIKEDVYTSLSDYIKLEGEVNLEFRLVNTKALIEANEEIPEVPFSITYPSEYIEDFTLGSQLKSTPKKKHLRFPVNFGETPDYSSRSSSSTSYNSNDSGSSRDAFQIRDNSPEAGQVSPLIETSPQETLNEGGKELIYVSHIVNPHNFYVQRACQEHQVQELKEVFKKGIFYERPPEEDVTEGNFFLVYNYEKHFWQRCRVVRIEKTNEDTTIYHVFCIDFGNSEAVEIESLRYIPPGRVQCPPPLAINCSLVDLQPIEGTWTSNDSLLMQKIIDNKQAVVHIKHVNYLPTGIMQLEGNVTTLEDGISVAHALIFHCCALATDHIPNPTAQIFAVWQKPKILKEDYNISVAEVVITYIACAEHFYVRKLNVKSAYEKLCKDLEKEYRFTNNADIIYLPEKTMACVAHVQDYGLGTRWARGVVMDLEANSMVSVMLTDIGALVNLHWRDLRRIRKKFTVQLGYAIECQLFGVTPRNNHWCNGSTEFLKSFQNKPLEMHVKYISKRSSLGVELYDKNDNLNIICINEEMVKNKFAIYFGCNKNTEANKLVFDEEYPLVKQTPKKRVRKIKGPFKFQVNILNYVSPSQMYLSFHYTQKLYSELFEITNILSTTTKTQGKIDWKVGDKCCAFYNQSQTWLRAVILELDNENAKVFYSDLGSVETVPVINLREIGQKLASVCDAAVLCHLHGVTPAEGEEWQSLTIEFIKELLDEYNMFSVTRVGGFINESLPIELWMKKTKEGGGAEPDKREWISLNKLILEQGLGIPVKQETEKTATCCKVREKQTFYNTNQDRIHIAPMVLKALKVEFDELLTEASSTPVETDTSNEESQISESLSTGLAAASTVDH